MIRFSKNSVIAVLLTTGCHTANSYIDAEGLSTGAPQHSMIKQATDSDSIHGDDKLTLVAAKARTTTPSPKVNVASVQSVASQQKLSDKQSAVPEPLPVLQPLLVPEPVPIPQPTDAAVSDWSLADLEGMALQNNPALAQAAARVDAARGNWVQVGLPPNLELGYSGQQLGSHGKAEQQGVFVGQEFVTGKKLRLNRQVAGWEIQRAERELEAFRLRVLTDVRIGYYDVLIAQRRRELAAELVRIAEQGEAAAQALFNGREVSEADPLRARVEAETARILLQTSINQHLQSWRRITAVLGMPDLALQRLHGELNADELDLSWQDTLRTVLSDSPEITAAIADVEAARWAVERAYAQVVPNVDVQAIFQDDRGTGSTNGNLQVTLPVPLWNRNQGGIRRAQAEVAAAQRAVDRIALDLQARLAVAFQRYDSARNQVDKYARKDGVLETATRTLELIRTGYKAEEYGVLDLLSVQRTFFHTNLAFLDAQRELWIAVMEIRGLLLRGSLGLGE